MTDPTRNLDEGDGTSAEPRGGPKSGMPRWLKISLIVFVVLGLLAVVLLRLGGHEGGPGPGGHGASSATPAAGVMESGLRWA